MDHHTGIRDALLPLFPLIPLSHASGNINSLVLRGAASPLTLGLCRSDMGHRLRPDQSELFVSQAPIGQTWAHNPSWANESQL